MGNLGARVRSLGFLLLLVSPRRAPGGRALVHSRRSSPEPRVQRDGRDAPPVAVRLVLGALLHTVPPARNPTDAVLRGDLIDLVLRAHHTHSLLQPPKPLLFHDPGDPHSPPRHEPTLHRQEPGGLVHDLGSPVRHVRRSGSPRTADAGLSRRLSKSRRRLGTVAVPAPAGARFTLRAERRGRRSSPARAPRLASAWV